MASTTLSYTVYVKGSPEAIWDAIVTPEQVARYGYGGNLEIDARAGGSYRLGATEEMKQYGQPDVVVSGEIVEAQEPGRLVQTWQAHFTPEIEAEPVGTVTWATAPAAPMMFPAGGVTQLTVTHELDDSAPITKAIVSGAEADAGGGWALVLSDLKTFVETGSSLAGR